jgi:hypothetical protein
MISDIKIKKLTGNNILINPTDRTMPISKLLTSVFWEGPSQNFFKFNAIFFGDFKHKNPMTGEITIIIKKIILAILFNHSLSINISESLLTNHYKDSKPY